MGARWAYDRGRRMGRTGCQARVAGGKAGCSQPGRHARRRALVRSCDAQSGCWKRMCAPRSMKLAVLRRRMSAFLLAQYCMATSKLVVVDIGASSVPPSSRNSSGISALRMPRHRSCCWIFPLAWVGFGSGSGSGEGLGSGVG